jgi:hypothetical protein
MIVGLAGGDTDTTRDYEYTDWDAVERFADAFALSEISGGPQSGIIAAMISTTLTP